MKPQKTQEEKFSFHSGSSAEQKAGLQGEIVQDTNRNHGTESSDSNKGN